MTHKHLGFKTLPLSLKCFLSQISTPYPRHLNCGPWTSRISFTRKPVGSLDSQAPTPDWIRTCILSGLPGDPCAHESLSGPALQGSVVSDGTDGLTYGSTLHLLMLKKMDISCFGYGPCLPTPHVPAHPTPLCYLGQWQCPCSGTAAAPQPQTLSPAVITCCSLSCRPGECWTRNPPSSPGNCGFL